MITNEDKKFYDENGYLLVKNVLTKEEVAWLRKRAIEIFTNGEWKVSQYNTDRTIADVYRYFPDIMRVSLNQKVVNAIKALLGSDDILLIPETAMMKGFYPTWHKDSTTQEKMGHMFHKDPEFKMIRTGIYFQDNDEFGGGLSVFAGSHKTPDNFLGKFPERTLYTRILNKIIPQKDENSKFLNPYKLKKVDIPSQVGDMVIFNFQTAHRGTLPKSQRIGDVPFDKTKYGLFDIYGVNNKGTAQYVDFIKTRPENLYGFARDRARSQEYDEYTKSLGLGII